jgi:hypothetical protein
MITKHSYTHDGSAGEQQLAVEQLRLPLRLHQTMPGVLCQRSGCCCRLNSRKQPLHQQIHC